MKECAGCGGSILVLLTSYEASLLTELPHPVTQELINLCGGAAFVFCKCKSRIFHVAADIQIDEIFFNTSLHKTPLLDPWHSNLVKCQKEV